MGRVPHSLAELVADLEAQADEQLRARPTDQEREAYLGMDEDTFRLSVLTELAVLRSDMERNDNRTMKLLQMWDVVMSPWWKVALFVLDGWPLRSIARRPQWRPWRRWWTS